MTRKTCITCGIEKNVEEFPKRNNRKKNPWGSKCKACSAAWARENIARKGTTHVMRNCESCGIEFEWLSTGPKQRFCKPDCQKFDHPTVETQVCSACGVERNASEFSRDARKLSGLRSSCKVCDRARCAGYWQRAPESKRKAWARRDKSRLLERKFGITIDQYDAILKMQNDCCPICQISFDYEFSRATSGSAPVIDHCHKSNSFRGVICSNCNKGLGCFKDSKDALGRAITYLESHGGEADGDEDED